VIISRAQHPISRALVSENALKVLHRLKDAGYASLLVGGCVRDLMLGREPKDFDVVTDASPEQIHKLFRNARLIGRRFRLAHIRFGREIIEVATFRALPRTAGEDDANGRAAGDAMAAAGRLLRDNVFGTQEEDALRRDFTINALYYNIRDFSVLDYVGGAADLEQGRLRMIGESEVRYREDPVRMLRAVRFAAKLGFRIEADTARPIRELAPLLRQVPPARLFEEVLKLFHGGCAAETYELLRQFGLFAYLFPHTEASLSHEESGFPRTLVAQALRNTDERIEQHKSVTPAFLFAVLLWYPVQEVVRRFVGQGINPNDALIRAAEHVLREQIQHVSIPKRISVPMREIWELQSRLERRNGLQAARLVQNTRFRAGYDLLLLRASVGDADAELASWWTRFQEVDEAGRKEMMASLTPARGTKKRRRARRRKSKSKIQAQPSGGG
jgi:poly(A) polymerase